MKLKNVQAYPIENVPDFLVEECKDLGIKMLTSLIPYFQKHHPNIILGAMAFIHASMIKNLVSDKTEELEKATKLAALALIKNVEFLSRLTEQ